ncbi:MAG: hypothetical protein ACPL88_08445, partial [Bryobacteraceae bacterium]
LSASVGGTTVEGRAGGWLKLEREWNEGEQIEIRISMGAGWVRGEPSYPGYVALVRGPQVLALDAELNPQVESLYRVAVEPGSSLRLTAVREAQKGPARQAYGVEGVALSLRGAKRAVVRTKLVLAPYGDTRHCRVWLPTRMIVGPVAVTVFGEESSSGDGPVSDSIVDERIDTYRTARGKGNEGSWFAVELEQPEWIERIVFRHGKVSPDGGWFDTSEGKPVVQIKRSVQGAWETVGRLESYPDTHGRRLPALYDGQPFELKLGRPVLAAGIRVVGRPGGNYSSCAELAAYGAASRGVAVSADGRSGGPLRLAQRD